jgi:hypothetical protein
MAVFDSMPALKDIAQRAAKAVAGEPLTVFNLLVSLIKSMCPRESIYLKEHFHVVNSLATMILGDQGAGKSPMMNSMKTVLKLIEKDMQKRFEGFHIPWVLADLSIPGIIKCMESSPTILKSVALVLLDELDVLTDVTGLGASQESKCKASPFPL